jgi:cytochrome c551/c552
MSQETQDKTMTISVWPLVIGVVIFIAFGVIFVLEFLDLSRSEGGLSDDLVTADAYIAELESLLADVNPARAQEHLINYGCTSCHGSGLAPSYDVVQANAALRRPPMTAAAYIYESIIHPGAYVVEGYQNNMPRTYETTFLNDEGTRADLGDMIVYLAGDMSVVDVEDDVQPDEADAAVDDVVIDISAERIAEYEGVAEFLLSGASAERGESLVEEYGCNVCHGGQAADVVAPSYELTAELAVERRPPLSAAAYIYEAIIYPGRYVVDGWPNSMPQNYEEIIDSTDLGDMMAYLLQLDT